MTVIGDKALTMLDMVGEGHGAAKDRPAVMKLAQSAPLMRDLLMQASNQVLQHTSDVNVGLPTVTQTGFNEPVSPSKAIYDSVTDTMTMLEVSSELDTRLAMVYGSSKDDIAVARAKKSGPFLEALSQEWHRIAIYGNPTTSPKEFRGLALRYTALAQDNVISCGGTTADSQTSVYLFCHKQDCAHGIFPKNTTAGMHQHDYGIEPVNAAVGTGQGRYHAYIEHFMYAAGLHIPDDRYVVRLCNIEATDVETVSGTQQIEDYNTNIFIRMGLAISKIPDLESSKPVFYMPRTVYGGMIAQALARSQSNGFTVSQVTGGPGMVAAYLGIPCKPLDQIGYAEAVVS